MGSIAELRGHVATPADTISDTFSCLLAAKWTRADTYGHEWTRFVSTCIRSGHVRTCPLLQRESVGGLFQMTAIS
jgi:hypothetical protein